MQYLYHTIQPGNILVPYLIIQLIKHRDPSNVELDLQSLRKHVNMQGFLKMDPNLLVFADCIDYHYPYITTHTPLADHTHSLNLSFNQRKEEDQINPNLFLLTRAYPFVQVI